MTSVHEIMSILNFFPNKKFLKLLECDFKEDKNTNTTLDLAHVDLQEMTLDIKSMMKKNGKRKSLLLQLGRKEKHKTN